MKFQNPSMHGSLDMACIRFHSDFIQRGITSEREITRTRKKKTTPIYPVNFFEVGGVINHCLEVSCNVDYITSMYRA